MYTHAKLTFFFYLEKIVKAKEEMEIIEKTKLELLSGKNKRKKKLTYRTL